MPWFDRAQRALTSQSRSRSRRRARADSSRQGFAFETLEPRIALAAAGLITTPQTYSGVLNDKIVFTSGGHGWQWSDVLNRYATDRGDNNEIVEDFGNQEQMTAFADYALRAGATVVPMRPVGRQLNEVVLDNDSAGVTFTGTWSNSGSTRYYDEDYGSSADAIPYRFASTVTGAATATATYTPNIPQAGFYPVYAWVLRGTDRTEQTYRVDHTGGSTEITVNHSKVGSGWVYLGTYHFNAGSSATGEGSVVITNKAPATGSVVIADAIRFGNGMGDWVDTPTGAPGISGYPREDENSFHWIARSVGVGTTLTTATGASSNNNVSAPSNFAQYMFAGTFGEAVYVGFHSNAGGGRGARGLIDSSAPTPNQAGANGLADVLGDQINQDMQSLNGVFEYTWTTGTTSTFTGAFGEINLGSGAEMDATIIETAFHDSVEDAAIMRDPLGRDQISRSVLQGTVQYFSLYGSPVVANTSLPTPPTNVRVASNASGAVTLNWSAGPSTPAGAYGAAATGYKVYASVDGYGFDGGRAVAGGGTTTLTITGLDANTAYFFKVAATNAGGESSGSEVVAALPSGGAKQVLLVNGFDRFDRTQNFRYPYLGQFVDRVWPRYNNSFDYVVQHATAIQAAKPGTHVATTSNDAVISGAVNLTDYDVVIWISGTESTVDDTFNATEQTKVTQFLAAGGNLFLSGAEIGWDLDQQNNGRTFYETTLKANYVNDDASTYTATADAAGIFSGMSSFVFSNGTAFSQQDNQLYDVAFPDVIAPQAGAISALTYSGGTGGTAGIQAGTGGIGTGSLVMFGFPFETMTNASRRQNAMGRILDFLGAGITIEARVNGQDADSATGPIVATGGTATFTYIVANTGIVALSGLAVVDDNGTPGTTGDDFSPTLTSGDVNSNSVLDVGETWTYTANRTVVAGQRTHSGKVTVTTSAQTIVTSDPANYFGSSPAVSLQTSVDGQDADSPPGPSLTAGSTAAFGYTLTNTGNIVLSNVAVTDDNGTPGNTGDDFSPTYFSGDTNTNSLLDLSETWTFTATRTVVAGQYTGLGSVTAQDSIAQVVTSSDQTNYSGVVPENADFNEDTLVDTADFILWRMNDGLDSGATHLQGDANNDGAVDATDYNIWRAQFGSTIPAAGAAAGLAALLDDEGSGGGLLAPGLVATPQTYSGALNNKIVFTSAGHGWQWNSGLNRYATDRPEYQLVEDFGTQDQLTFYADYLLRSGATVVPMRPVGRQTNEVVLDNDSAGVTFTGAWSNSAGTQFYDEDYGAAADAVPYRFASTTSGAETSVATYTPSIPSAGFYPVYTWVVRSANRTTQLYRVNHTGGTTEIRVDHRAVGYGWVYLGTYHFGSGSSSTSGSVQISNNSNVSGVVIADAIRFGNGIGDAELNGAPSASGYPREDENSLHWIFRMLGQGTTLTSSGVGTSNVSAPSNMAEWMYSGAFGDAVYVGFHSNGTTGDPITATARGAVGLITSSGATPNQSNLALFLGRQINQDMQNQPGVFEHNWSTRTTHTFTSSFGEIDLGASAEMDATIIEVAFHDNIQDGALLRDPKARDAIARATYQGTLEYFDVHGGLATPPSLPTAPTNVRAVSNASGQVTINWSAGASTPASVNGDAATGYKVYASIDGYGFDGGTVVAGVGNTSATLSGYDPTLPYYFRVTATNAGGESKASEVMTVLPTGGVKQVLIVGGFDRHDRTQDFDYPYAYTGDGLVDRVWARYNNSVDYVVQAHSAINASKPGVHVASTSNEAVISGAVNLTDYDTVVWILGNEGGAAATAPVSRSLDATEQTKITQFISAGGNLFISGSDIAWDLDQQNNGRTFYENTLKGNYVGDDAGTYTATAAAGGIFAGMSSFAISNGSAFSSLDSQVYNVDVPDVIAPQAGAVAALTYSGGTGGTAAIQVLGTGGAGSIVMFGFPFEAMTNATRRQQAMGEILDFFGLAAPAPAVDIKTRVEGQDADSPPGPTLAASGSATFTYVLTNAGNVPISGVVVTDDNGTAGNGADDFNPTYSGGDTNSNSQLDVGETWTYTAIRTVVAGQYTSIGSVNATGNAVAISDTDPANYFGSAPGVGIETQVNGDDADSPPGASLPVGSTANITYVVSNIGNVPLGSIAVTDDNGTPGDSGDDIIAVYSSGDTNSNLQLDLGETWTYTASRIVTAGQFTNVGSASGQDSISQVVSASDPANHFGVLPDNADFNEDSIVDAADYILWRLNDGLASGATHSQGDANGDGAVDSTDYDIWRAQFGSTFPAVGSGSSAGDALSIAEVSVSESATAAHYDAAIGQLSSHVTDPQIAQPGRSARCRFTVNETDGPWATLLTVLANRKAEWDLADRPAAVTGNLPTEGTACANGKGLEAGLGQFSKLKMAWPGL